MAKEIKYNPDGDNVVDMPVKLVIRFTQRKDETRIRALLIAINPKGKEYTFTYDDFVNGSTEYLGVEPRD